MSPRSSRPSHRLTHLIVVASTLVVAAPAMFPEVAHAAVGDQRREVERIVDQLDALHQKADILAEDYAEAVDNKNQLDLEVVAAEQRVAEMQAQLGTLRGDLAEVAIRSFTGSGNDLLGPLFSNTTQYGEGLRRDQYSRVALSVGTSTTDDLDELLTALDAEQQGLQDKRDEVEVLQATIVDKQRQTEETTADYEQQRDAAEAKLGQLIEEEEARRAAAALAQLQAEFAKQQADAASAAASAAAATDNGGGNSNAGDSNGGNSNGGNTAPAPAAASNGGGNSNNAAPAAAAPSARAEAPAPQPAPSNVPAVSGLAGVAVNAAMGQLGVRYVYATSSPGVSFDCSGLTHYAWAQAGVYLPRNSRAQAASTTRVPAAAAQPGDLIFYYSPISHVGIYLGNGQLVHAPNSGTVVKVSSVSWGKVTAVTRPG